MKTIKIKCRLIALFIITNLFLIMNIFSQDYQTFDVKTPRNGTVQDTWILSEFPNVPVYEYDPRCPCYRWFDNDIAYLNYITPILYYGTEVVGSASRTYNCHGYAWWVSEGGFPAWIGYYGLSPQSLFWIDGSYSPVSEMYATKVSYSGDHSATTTGTPGIYISKWGAYPLMRHAADNCPSGYGSPANFYHRSVNVPIDCSTIQTAVNNWVPGLTINVSSGTYNESVFATGQNGISISGQGPGSTVITGLMVFNSTINQYINNLSTYVLYNYNCTSPSLSSIELTSQDPPGLSLSNCSGASVSGISVYSNPNSLAAGFSGSTGGISGSSFHDHDYALMFSSSSNFSVSSTYFCNNNLDIYTDANSYVSTSGCTFSGDPTVKTSGNVTWSGYSICGSLLKRASKTLASIADYKDDPGHSDFSNTNSLYFDILKKIRDDVKSNGFQNKNNYSDEITKVIDKYKSFLELYPSSVFVKTAMSTVAHCYKQIGDYEGMKLFVSNISQNEKFAGIKENAKRYLIDYYEKKGEYSKALEAADEILNAKKKNPELICDVLLAKGLLYEFSLKNKDEAINVYQNLIDNYPENFISSVVKTHLKNLGRNISIKALKTNFSQDGDRLSISNYPNPFNPSTKIIYSIPSDSRVNLSIYNTLGQKIEELVNQEQVKGSYTIEWNPKNIPSGLYYYVLKTGKNTQIQKTMYMK